MKTNATIKTKINARAEAYESKLTINWDGMTEDDIRALAQQSLIIKLQGKMRADGTVPAELEVNATDYKIGVRAPKKPADLASLIKKMSPEDKAALLAQLSA